MRPVPIPESLRASLESEGARFVTLAAPSGDLLDDEVRPIEAAVHEMSVYGVGNGVRGQVVTSAVIQLEDDDLRHLADTGQLLLSVWGTGFPVFMIQPLTLIEGSGEDGSV